MSSSRQHKFRALIEAHGDDLYRYACWLSTDADMAQDLVQEAGLREAMTIGVPDDLVARVLLVQAIADEQAPRRRWLGAWSGLFSGSGTGQLCRGLRDP